MEKNNEFIQKLAQLAWPVCLLGFAVPYSRITVNGNGYQQILLKTYAGELAFGVLLLLALIQWGMFIFKKKWLAWPGFVAGIYALLLCIQLASTILGSFQNTDGNSLALVMKAENTPLPGLYLLGSAALVLLTGSIWQWLTDRKNRAFVSPMNS